MTDSELDRFARLLVRLVRDRAIHNCDQLMTGRIRGSVGERWRHLTESKDVKEVLSSLIPDVVDEVIFELLNAIDNGDLPMGWQGTEGAFVSLEELGQREMAGWYALPSQGGWIENFSEQRYVDPIPDLQLRLPDDNGSATATN